MLAAVILNPIARRRRQREETAAGAGDTESGRTLQGQIALAEAVAVVQSKHHCATNQIKEVE